MRVKLANGAGCQIAGVGKRLVAPLDKLPIDLVKISSQHDQLTPHLSLTLGKHRVIVQA